MKNLWTKDHLLLDILIENAAYSNGSSVPERIQQSCKRKGESY